ncbi:3-oxoadipate enol-lactonase [Streptomyces sp. NPDC058426]|uniref:bifunctional 3-oxoadipate enol-lactonase/4-carboxymuconolactone decarboxylase PcaDC n=2 Tax=unclassified Streptomyces TaxID=2593676 RepID=UPI0036578120
MSLLHHTTEGRPEAPALILGPSLGTALRLWDAQAPALARRHHVIRYDLPGHGASPAEADPPRTVAALAARVLALADALAVERFAYAGVSLGGAIGAHLAAHHPDRVTSLALVCASADFGAPEPWHARAARVRAEGVDRLAETAPARWFTPGHTPTEATRALVADQRAADPEAYAACCEAIAAYHLDEETLARVTAPTLVLAGRQDTATPPAHARHLADAVPHASLTEIDGAAHLAPAEQPDRVTIALLDHFGSTTAHSEGPAAHPEGLAAHREGLAVRRDVLGADHVDRATAATTAFTAPFQDFITRYAWGEIWTRPGLDRRTRSCVTLTALVARGHHEELALHVRAAVTNGLTPEEIGEVLLQSAVYCGVPAANSAFAVAARVLAELDKEDPR